MATATQQDVLVPDIGDFSDVPIIEVFVKPGDTVAPEDPLITLESDKATMDVPAPVGGVVQEVKVAVGDTVSEGSLILTLAPSENGAGAPAAAEPSAEESRADHTQPAQVTESTRDIAADAPPAEAGAVGAVETAVDAETNAVEEARRPEPKTIPGPEGDGAVDVHASPGVRRLARELEIDLRQVQGSGPKGRITKDDLRAFLARPAAGAPAAPSQDGAALGLAPWPQVDFAKFGPIERQPLSRIKKISGPNLHRNWVMIPHVTHQDEADITDLEAFRKQTNEAYAKRGVKLTMVGFLLKACVAALKEFPEFNASLDGDDLVLKQYYHLGFAADTPQGLVVPVIKDVDKKGLIELAEELGRLSAQARDGKLAPGDMRGGTFTISSLGGIGGTAFTPIVNAPEVAILGVTRSAMRPVWNGREFTPRLMVPLSLSYDHRVIDGALAARFTAYLVSVLGDLRRVLL